jgi:hypothetical protein
MGFAIPIMTCAINANQYCISRGSVSSSSKGAINSAVLRARIRPPTKVKAVDSTTTPLKSRQVLLSLFCTTTCFFYDAFCDISQITSFRHFIRCLPRPRDACRPRVSTHIVTEKSHTNCSSGRKTNPGRLHSSPRSYRLSHEQRLQHVQCLIDLLTLT